MHEFYDFYAMTVLLNTPRGGKNIEHPQLEQMLMRGVTVNISAAAICQVLFRPEYIASVSTTESDPRLRLG